MTLERRVPPLLLSVLIGAAMSLSGWLLPGLSIGPGASGRLLAGLGLALVGAVVALAGVIAFHRAKTSVNPLSPAAVSSLVTGGIYQVSRNPMYLGFLLVLTGWALWLGNWAALAGLPVFVLYMNRYQIVPEERWLAGAFGEAFTAYCRSVRRWL